MAKDILTRVEFEEHKDKPWQVVHGIWPGIRDLAGVPGPKGAIGLLGNTGPQGPEGDVGPQGATGPGGVTGPQGEIGESGPQGPTGPGGVTGPQGEIGESGPQGPSGPTGIQGAMGERGIGHSILGSGCMLYLPIIAGEGAVVYDKADAKHAVGELEFDSGSIEPLVGDILTGVTSGATAKVVSVTKDGGTWEGGDADGSIVLEDYEGCFNDDEEVAGSTGGDNVLTVNHPDGVVGADGFVKNGAFVHDNDPPNDWSLDHQGVLTTEAGGAVGNCIMVKSALSDIAGTYQNVTVVPEKIYKFRGWFKMGVGTSAYFGIYDMDNVGIIQRWTNLSNSDWEVFEHIFVVPAGCTTVRIEANLEQGVTNNTFYLDEITFHEYWPENDGEVEGAQWVFSDLSEKCLSFDGDDDFISVPNSRSLNFGVGDFSISFWVKLAGVVDDDAIIDKHATDFGIGYGIFLKETGGQFQFNLHAEDTVPNEIQNVNDTLLDYDTWYHYVATFDRDGNAIHYVDGEQDCTPQSMASVGDIDNLNPLLIGKSLGGNFTNGLINEIRIYNRVLTADEVGSIFYQRYLTGVEGVQGPQGITGVQGPQGATGVTGVQGDQGVTGVQGDQGTQGVTGVEGDAGPQGPTGVEGELGAGMGRFVEIFDGLSLGNINGKGDYGSLVWIDGTWVNTSGTGCTAEVATRSGADKMLRLDDQGVGECVATLNYEDGYEVVVGVFEYEGRNSVTNKTAQVALRKGVTNFLRVEFADTAQIKIIGSDGVEHTIQAFSANTWYKIKVFFDAGAGYFLVWIDDVFKAKYVINFTNAYYADNIRASTKTIANTYTFDVDNLKVMHYIAI